MRIWLSIIIGLLCAGCQTAMGIDTRTDDPPDDPPNCKGVGGASNKAACRILVKVIEVDGKCRVKLVDPFQDDVLFQLGEKNLWIVWQLNRDSANYRFLDRTGIEFENDPLENFKPRKVLRDGERFAAKNRNSAAFGYGDYKYMVNVERRNAGVRCEFDPLVRNR